MPLITVDTSVALPAALKAGSVPRKLWVVLAYGALTYQAEHLRLDRDELVQLAEAEGGEVLATGALDEMVESAERRRTVLSELLPYGTPSDYVAVGFASLFNEFERKVRQAGRKFNPELRPEDAAAIRRQFEAICAVAAPPFQPTDLPALTRDPEDDPIVWGALLAGCDILISDDKDIVPDGVEQTYEHGEVGYERSDLAGSSPRSLSRRTFHGAKSTAVGCWSRSGGSGDSRQADAAPALRSGHPLQRSP